MGVAENIAAVPVAGSYEGHAAVFGEIGQRMQPLDDWTIEVRAVMGNADMVVAVVDLVAARGPHRVACSAAHAFRFDAEGRIAETWGFVDDQAKLDALFSYMTLLRARFGVDGGLDADEGRPAARPRRGPVAGGH